MTFAPEVWHPCFPKSAGSTKIPDPLGESAGLQTGTGLEGRSPDGAIYRDEKAGPDGSNQTAPLE